MNKKSKDLYNCQISCQINGVDEEQIIKKQQKNEKEENIYKDLQDRNALLTIYRDCQDEQMPILPTSNQIIESVTWLSNYQSQIVDKNDTWKLLEKQSIKNILTAINKKNYSQQIHQEPQSKINQTLQFYVNEATEKQQEGIINNVLLLIQPLQKQQQDEYNNYFLECVAHTIQSSKKLPSQLKETSKGNKVVIINLTGRESQQNLQTFDSIMQKDDEYLYFSFYKAKNEQETKKYFQKQFELMKLASCSQFIIPFIPKNGNIFDGNYLYSLFEMFLENKIQKFSNLNYIVLTLEISEEIEYEHYGLHQLFQKLMELSNQRLIVHVHFAFNQISDEQNIKIKQYLNICYFSFLEKIKNKFQYFQFENKLILIDLLNQTHEFYRAINLDEWSENLPKQRAINIASNLKQFQIKPDMENQVKRTDILDDQFINPLQQRKMCMIDNLEQVQTETENEKQMASQEQNSSYVILYKKSSEKMLIIKLILNGYKITPKTFIKIDYEEELIIIYQNQHYEDQNQFFVYAFVTQEMYNRRDIKCELQFCELQYHDSTMVVKELQNPIVFQKYQNIYFLYGTQKDHELINNNCYKYSLKDQSWTIIPRAKDIKAEESQMLGRHDQKKPREFFSNQISMKKLRGEDIQNILENRVNATVCFDQSVSYVQPILFGGEYVKFPQIVNMIECIDIKENEFQSWLIDKQQMYKDQSIKPFPNQLILQSNFDKTYYYLLLPGNDNYREKKQNHPANQSIQNYVTVIQKTTSECSVKKQKIKYIGKCFEIISFNNRQHNIQYIGYLRNIFLWRVIFIEEITDEISLKTLSDLDVFVYQSANQINKQQHEKNCITNIQSMPFETDIFSLFENYLKNGNYQQRKENTGMILEQIETKDQFQLSKLKIIQNDENNKIKYKCKKYTLAFENYIGYDHTSSNLLIKQYIYQLKEPYKVEINDFQEEIDIPVGNIANNKNIKRTDVLDDTYHKKIHDK